MKKQTVLALALAVFSAGAWAVNAPVKTYRSGTEHGLLACKIQFMLAQAKGKRSAATGQRDAPGTSDSDYDACIEEHSKKSKEALSGALDALQSDDAKKALKAYHVAFVVALKGIAPGTAEREITYEQRQQALRDKVNEAWAAFEVEQ